MMNTRIKELADQAAVNDVAKNFNGEDYTVRMPSETWAREFAELIVRECADIAKTAEPYKSDDLILKRFGFDNV
jgi:hypothetical protein